MFHECKSKEDVNKLFKKLASYLHPDKGGCNVLMILLQESRDISLESIRLDRPYKKSNKKYKIEVENIFEGDIRLKILKDIMEFSKTRKRFSLDFTLSVEEYLENRGYITSNQYNRLVNCYYAFRMDEELEDKDQ